MRYTLILPSHSIEADCPDLLIETFDDADCLVDYLIELGDFGPDDAAAVDLSSPGVVPISIMVGEFGIVSAVVVVQA